MSKSAPEGFEIDIPNYYSNYSQHLIVWRKDITGETMNVEDFLEEVGGVFFTIRCGSIIAWRRVDLPEPTGPHKP